MNHKNYLSPSYLQKMSIQVSDRDKSLFVNMAVEYGFQCYWEGVVCFLVCFCHLFFKLTQYITSGVIHIEYKINTSVLALDTPTYLNQSYAVPFGYL